MNEYMNTRLLDQRVATFRTPWLDAVAGNPGRDGDDNSRYGPQDNWTTVFS